MLFSSLSHLLKSGTCKEAAQASEVETDAKKCKKESGMGPAFRIHRQEATTWTLGMECCFRKKKENYVKIIFTIWERLFCNQNLETSTAAIFLVRHFATLLAIQCSDEMCIFRYWIENLQGVWTEMALWHFWEYLYICLELIAYILLFELPTAYLQFWQKVALFKATMQ